MLVEKPFIMNQPIQPIKKTFSTPGGETAKAKTSFDQMLQEQLRQSGDIKFSRHAQARLDTRNIILTPQTLSRLEDAVQKAQSKGCKESLVVVDDLAFVVSIKNKTVITAVDGDNRRENVFTNIDSAVIS